MTVADNLNLGNSVARDERGSFWYVQGPEPNFDGISACGLVLDPCRLVRASASPFSSKTRALLPRVRVSAPTGLQIFAFASDPLELSGEVTRTVVRGSAIVAREPLAGVAVELLRTVTIDRPGSPPATGLRTTTDSAEHWALPLTNPPPTASFLISAPSLRIIGRLGCGDNAWATVANVVLAGLARRSRSPRRSRAGTAHGCRLRSMRSAAPPPTAVRAPRCALWPEPNRTAARRRPLGP